MNFTHLFGIKIAQTYPLELKQFLKDLPLEAKIGLNFVYSEVFLRANRNRSYRQVIDSMLNVCDGKGLNWAIWTDKRRERVKSNLNHLDRPLNSKNMTNQNLFKYSDFRPTSSEKVITTHSPNPDLESEKSHSKTQTYLWKIYFYILLFKELLWNFLTGLLILTGCQFGHQVILGRDFVYQLFGLALEKNWKIAIIGGNELVQQNLYQKMPHLQTSFWFRDANSDLMQDKIRSLEIPANQNQTSKSKPSLTQIHSFLTTDSLIPNFPELSHCQKWLEDQQADLILICLGGASGKQEFLLDLLRQDPKLKFTLGVCLGAALDHLGGGAKQKEAPKIMQKLGLEWLFRFVSQPYRRARIWDSVIGLWWTVTLAKFVPLNQEIKLDNALNVKNY